MIENGEYNKVLFVFDSDYEKDNKKTGGFENSKREIQDIIRQLKEKVDFDFYTDYYIMCDPETKSGNLEHLIISTLPEEKQDCVKNLLECIKHHKNNGDKKIVVSSYKTIFDEPNYNFSHHNFDKLKEKIQNLSK